MSAEDQALTREAFNIRSWDIASTGGPNQAEDDGGSEWNRLLNVVEAHERKRICRFVFDKDQRSALAGRLLIRRLIMRQFGVDNSHVVLDRTDKNKPFLVEPSGAAHGRPHFNFNMSHGGAWVVMCSSSTHLVGCDVEEVRITGRDTELSEFFQHMNSCFTVNEWRSIREGFPFERPTTSPPPSPSSPHRPPPSQQQHQRQSSRELDFVSRMQLRRFFWHWVCKEAFIKAIGVGLGYDLQSIEMHFSQPFFPIHKSRQPAPSFDAVENNNSRMATLSKDLHADIRIWGRVASEWRFELHELDTDHVCAIATGPISAAHDEFKRKCFGGLVAPVSPSSPTPPTSPNSIIVAPPHTLFPNSSFPSFIVVSPQELSASFATER